MLDDLLIEIVVILNQEEERERERQKQEKRRNMLLDYTEAFKELDLEQEKIKAKLQNPKSDIGANQRAFREL